MKRFGAMIVMGFLALSVASGIAEAGPRQQRNQAQTPQQQQNQVQQLIELVYVNRFQNTVGLSDEQFLKVGTFIRQFIQMRFRIANQRNALIQRRTQLLEQADPPEADVRQLGEDTAQLERTVGNMESNFIAKIQAELTPRQILLVRTFNARFIEEELPRLIETVRAEVGARGRGQAARPNANGARRNNALTPADSLPAGKK